MHILITGSEGSLAQMIIPRLLEQGHEVVGYDNFVRYGVVERQRAYEFHRGDLCDTAIAQSIFAKREFGAVFHLAALVYGVVGFHKKPADIIIDNNLLTMNLLKYGHSRMQKFIYLSSSMVYEQCRTWPHKEEDTQTTPVMSTSYGLSKYIGERIVQSFFEQENMKYVIWRPFNIITPFESAEEEGFSHVFSDMVEKILIKKLNPIPVLGDGHQIRCFTNIYDVAEVITKFSLDPRAENEVFNIGNPEPVSVQELIAKIVAMGKQYRLLPDDYEIRLTHQPVYADDVRKRIPDVSKMKRVFGWEARTRVDESLSMYMARKFSLSPLPSFPEKDQQVDKICVLGMGYVGLTLAVTLAEQGFEVLGVDIVPEVVERLQRQETYFFEPGLAELLQRYGGKNLQFALDIPEATFSYYIISVGTPINQTTLKPDLTYVTNAVKSITSRLKKGDTVILRSTVPVGTSRNLGRMIEVATGLRCGVDFFFGFVPERTVEGKGLCEQKEIPQLVGAINPDSAERIAKVFRTFNGQLIIMPDLEHAEMCKIIDNTYRDVNFAYANQMAMICEQLGLEFRVVRNACNEGYFRNNVPDASPGVGGACLTKDPYILIDLCERHNIDTQLIKAGRAINQQMVHHLARKILTRLSALEKNIHSAKIFIMGFAFKGEPETSDTRFSTTFELVNLLRPVCAHLYGYDGVASTEDIVAASVTPCTIEEGFHGADVVVIMNSHRTHHGLDIAALAKTSRTPLIFVDCWNLYDEQLLPTDGSIIYSSVGLY